MNEPAPLRVSPGENMTTDKRCSKCGSTGPFGRDKGAKDGLNYWCKPCVNAQGKQWATTNPEKRKAASDAYRSVPANRAKAKAARIAWGIENPDRVYATKRRSVLRGHGLTEATFAEMLSAQGGVCRICKGGMTSGRGPAIDHCHKTGRVRGILCGECNTGIGLLGDDVGRLLAAVAYLRESATVSGPDSAK